MSDVTETKSAAPADDGAKMSWTELLLSYPNLVRGISIVIFICLWEFFGRRIDPLFMTYPTAVARALVDLLASGELIRGLLDSLSSFSMGMVFSIVFGVLIGLLMGTSRLFEYAIDPYINALNAIPRVALVPLIILWFGLGFNAKTIIIVSVAIFPIIINTYAGVRDIRGSLLEVGRVYSATEMQMFRKIILPAALPFIMAGIRLGVGLGIIGMIVAEFFTAIGGLGGMIVNYGNTFQTAKMFVPITAIGVLGILLTEFVMYLERRLAPWRQSERDRG